MTIAPIQGLSTVAVPSTAASASTGTSAFSTYLSSALDNVNNLSNQADQLSATYAAGGPVSIDELMVAEQKASLAVDMVVQVRNRVVSAYQSIMNMQV